MQTNLGESTATPDPDFPLWGWGKGWSEVRALHLVTPHHQLQTASSVSLVLGGWVKEEGLRRWLELLVLSRVSGFRCLPFLLIYAALEQGECWANTSE